VTLKRADFAPTYFVVIFDDRAMIHGLYVPSGSGMNSVHYLEPILVENRSLESGAHRRLHQAV
jgi:hypothetical protein